MQLDTKPVRDGSRVMGINKQLQKARQQLTPAASFVGQGMLRKKKQEV